MLGGAIFASGDNVLFDHLVGDVVNTLTPWALH